MENQTTSEQISEISDLINSPAPAPETTEPEVDETTVDEVDTDTVDEVPNEVEDTDSDTITDTDEVEADDEMPKTVSEWADAIDVSPEDLYNMEIGMPDGHEPVPLGKLKNLYSEQLREQQRLETKIQEYEEHFQSTQQTQQQTNQVSQEEVNVMGKLSEIQRKYETTDWAELEREDPGNAALLRVKFQDANQQLQQEYAGIQNFKAEQMQTNQYNMIQNAAKHTMTLMPTWTDSEVRTNDITAIQELLTGEGISEQQQAQMNDPLAIKLLVELAGYRKQFGQAEKALTKVKKAPKQFRGGARKKTNKSKKTNDLISKAQKTTTAQGRKQAEINAAKSVLGF